MTDQELLARALSFDAGDMITVVSRGKTWTIFDGHAVLNCRGEWEYEPMFSHRENDFLERTRFATARAAFAFLEVWRAIPLTPGASP
jgi:hypothetical protein